MTQTSPPVDILVIIAHPDDESLCAGLIHHHSRHGRSVMIAVLTDGEGGPPAWDVKMDPRRIAALRRDEMKKSADALGVRRVEFLGFPDTYDQGTIDGELDEIVRRIGLLLKEHRPRIVLTHGPDGEYGHPEHIAVSRCTAAAVEHMEAAHRPLFYYCNAYYGDDPLPRSNVSVRANYVFPVTGRNHEARYKVWLSHVTQQQCFVWYIGRNMRNECYHRVGEPTEDAAWFEVALD